MTKSYVAFVQGLYAAMFSDIAGMFPMLRTELGRDSSRLRSAIEARGLSFVTIDLPAQLKHFDRCLAEGLLTASDLPYSGSWKRGYMIPKLFRGLYLRIFDCFGVLRDDADPHAIRALRQLLSLSKKLRMECADGRRYKVVSDFFTVDAGLRIPTLPWADDDLRPDQTISVSFGDAADLSRVADRRQLDLLDCAGDPSDPASYPYAAAERLQGVADVIISGFLSFDGEEWRAKHGPGAVAEQRGYLTKYRFPHWPVKLESVFPSSTHAYYSVWEAALDSPVRGPEATCDLSPHEPPSKLITVPKTQKAPRLIAAEPTAHQWCQQIILDYLRTAIDTSCLRHCISLRDQSNNQKWAMAASIHGSRATVDLSEASDRVSCWTVERLFRSQRYLLDALHASRTRWVMNTIDRHSPTHALLRKFSCMGSAVTFPVQSILFAICAIHAVLEAQGGYANARRIRQTAKEVRVYGDDIIVPTYALAELRDVLGYLQLKVNDNKTFGTGKFRESCGLDAWGGHDVTPVYSLTYPEKSRPESVISCVESSNNFERRGYHSTAQFLKSRVEACGRTFAHIPLRSPDSGLFGWKRFDASLWSPLKTRWNRNLHRLEGLVLSLRASATRLRDHSPRSLHQFFTDDPDPSLPWTSGITLRGKVHLRLTWEKM